MNESMEMLKEAERTGAVKIMIPVSELKFMLHQASKIEELQKTLEWYADEKNWKLGVHISMGSAFPLHEAIKSDKGKRARECLKGESE